MSSTKPPPPPPPITKGPQTIVCPGCAAKNPFTAKRCWLCLQDFSGAEPAAEWLPTPYERHATFQFSFASLMLTIALIAVLLGVFRILPGLGVVLAMIVAPAWIATCLTVLRRQSSQARPLALGERTAIFAVSVAIMVGIGVTVIAAIVGAVASFCGVMVISSGRSEAAGFGLIALIVAVVAFGVIAAIAAIFVYAWKTSRARRT